MKKGYEKLSLYTILFTDDCIKTSTNGNNNLEWDEN